MNSCARIRTCALVKITTRATKYANSAPQPRGPCYFRFFEGAAAGDEEAPAAAAATLFKLDCLPPMVGAAATAPDGGPPVADSPVDAEVGVGLQLPAPLPVINCPAAGALLVAAAAAGAPPAAEPTSSRRWLDRFGTGAASVGTAAGAEAADASAANSAGGPAPAGACAAPPLLSMLRPEVRDAVGAAPAEVATSSSRRRLRAPVPGAPPPAAAAAVAPGAMLGAAAAGGAFWAAVAEDVVDDGAEEEGVGETAGTGAPRPLAGPPPPPPLVVACDVDDGVTRENEKTLGTGPLPLPPSDDDDDAEDDER